MIEVELTYDRSSLRLVIRDNGIGIAQEIVSSGLPGHWGISGMRERGSTNRSAAERLEPARRWNRG